MLFLSGLFYCIAPVLILIGWFVLILFDRIQEGQSTLPAVSLLIVSLSFGAFGLAFMSVKWNNYRMNTNSAILLTLGLILLTLYQVLVIFGYENNEKFLPYSAFFLFFNVLFMSFLVFMDNFEGFEDVLALVKK